MLIFGRDGIIGNALRYPDECVRHKILDMVGDLALLGIDLHGLVVAHRSGHQTNAALARKLHELALKKTTLRKEQVDADGDTGSLALAGTAHRVATVGR